MAKLSLPSAISGYNLSIINDNFQSIADEFQGKVLYRNNPAGEPNVMENDLDMNSKRILNLAAPSNNNEPARLQDVLNAVAGSKTANLTEFTPYNHIVATNVQEAIQQAASFSYATNYVRGTLGWSDKFGMGIDITQAPYNADKTGATDASAAILAAAAAFPGVPLRAPAGTYRLDSEVLYETTSSNVFTPGFKISGDGPGLTIFDNRVASGFAFRCATDTLLKFQHTVRFHNLQITTTTNPASSGGISLRSAYNVEIEDVWIKGLTGDGIRIVMNNGDQDGSNVVNLNRCRLDTNAGWGLNTEISGSNNEISFLSIENSIFQGNGTTSASATPPSGGMKWKGQVLSMRNTGFTINENVGLFIPGGGGLANSAYLESVVFENNKKRGCYCTGIRGFVGVGLQFYNNASYTATSGLEFDGTTYTIEGVDVRNVVVRATAENNAYTAFKISGTNADTEGARVRNVIWDNFDYAGQTRFNGFSFDKVSNSGVLAVDDINNITFRPNIALEGNSVPLRLRGGAGGTPSTTGEWIEHKLPSSGIGKTNSGLAASAARYYVYLYDNAGTPSLDISATAPTLDSSTGYRVKTGATSYYYVGSVETNASGEFKTSAGGWLNPVLFPASQVGTFIKVWFDVDGKMRARPLTVDPTNDTDGTVIGTQS